MGNGSNDTSADILVIYQTFGKVSVVALLPGLPIPRKMHLDLSNTSFGHQKARSKTISAHD